ncbi:hypothetical protein V1527DRAFT_517596 [Lipomyces starkeyi]
MDRAIGRDVHFYLFSEADQPLVGNFLSMLDILIVAPGPFRVTLCNTGPGHYDIRPYSSRDNISSYKSFYIAATDVYIDTITITDQLCITRILSKTETGREESFQTQVRERDGKCVITGTVNVNAPINVWRGCEAAHIFPLFSEGYWVQNGISRAINSCRYGLLMQSGIHQNFDGFDFSVNPDDGYKIICFDKDPFGIGRRILDPICRNGEDGARDDLLRWHFRQAVLANMRGAGEPSFEMDFPPGSDMMGEILSGPEAGKRMEAELFSRLNGVSFT